MPKLHVVSKPNLRLVIVCALALTASVASASPPFELLGDTQGMGGLQARAVPGGASAAYFNPALLTDSPTGLQFGFVFVSQQIGISLNKRPGLQFDVPSEISNATRADFTQLDNYPVPTRDLQVGRKEDMIKHIQAFEKRPRQAAGTGHDSYTYMAFGIVVKGFEDRFAFGVTGLVPLSQFTTIHAFYNDEREQYFSNSLHPEMYGDRLTAPSIAFAAGLKVIDKLSLGVGATLSLKASANAATYVVDTSNLSKILIDMNTGVNVALAPHVGAAYTLLGDRLRLTATAHPPQRMEFATNFTFLLSTGISQGSGVPFVLNYMPWRFALGASIDLVHESDQTLSLVGSALFATWSQYIDRHGEKPSPAFAWSDTLSPTLGVRYRLGPVSTLLDVAYLPTPVPLQSGRSNYVDNDRVSSALGGEYAFSLFGAEAHVGVQLQTHYLVARAQSKLPTPTDASGENLAPELVKDEVPDDAHVSDKPVTGARGLQTNNPGWPGFESHGFIHAASLYLRAAI